MSNDKTHFGSVLVDVESQTQETLGVTSCRFQRNNFQEIFEISFLKSEMWRRWLKIGICDNNMHVTTYFGNLLTEALKKFWAFQQITEVKS